MILLGIESSCDETAAAVVENGTNILSSVVASQVDVHHIYGGVVPELASRKHVEAISLVVNDAISKAGVSKKELDAVAVTRGPGLVGALLVGFSFAKAFAYGLDIPFTGVNHLEGHINSVFLGSSSPPFPFVALLASGGHTSLYYVKSYTDYDLLGQTRDDAAGEAYDKVSKMLELGYPGGKVIDDLSKTGNADKVKFTRPYLDKKAFDFSFSGIKSAVARYIETNPDYKSHIPDIVAGFQEAVVDVLSYKLLYAAEATHCKAVAIVGGVAANSRLREKVCEMAEEKKISVHSPPVSLCGDNAAMIASVGYHHLLAERVGGLNDDVYSRAKMAPAMVINTK